MLGFTTLVSIQGMLGFTTLVRQFSRHAWILFELILVKTSKKLSTVIFSRDISFGV